MPMKIHKRKTARFCITKTWVHISPIPPLLQLNYRSAKCVAETDILDFAGDIIPSKETKQSLTDKKKPVKTEQEAPTKGTILEFFKTESASEKKQD